MLITSEVHYALLLMAHMARSGGLVTRKEVSEEKGIPSHFLAKIAQNLAKAELITVTQGPRGGYLINCDPSTTSVVEVIWAIKGTTKVTPVSINGRKPEGAIMALYDIIDAAVALELENIFLTELVD
jgi:Rrf2 family protein